MEGDKDNVLTYEAIFELLRKERASDGLQKIEDSFYPNVVSYIKEKEVVGEKEVSSNIKKMIKEIYERRERKIVSLAVDKCRLGMEGLNTSNMLKEERMIYDKTLKILIAGRISILETVLSGKITDDTDSSKNPPILTSTDNLSGEKTELSKEFPGESILVRFLHAVPQFVGKELELYGPFEQEEIANLPTEIAKLLITKGRVEEIKDK